MCFDGVDANNVNLAHKRSERAAADTCLGHLGHLDLAASHDLSSCSVSLVTVA